MRIFIPGSAGQLGRRLVDHFSSRSEVLGLDLPELDIANAESVRDATRSFEPDAIINAAAMTNVDRCEDEVDLAFRVNAEGPGILAAAGKECGATLVHFSTDFVFDGDRDGPPYREEDETNPLSVYGKSKLAGEEEVSASGTDSIILRLAWVYGAGAWNFVDWVTGEIEKGNNPRIVTDQIGSPTWVGDIASQVEKLLSEGQRGLYHCVGRGACSRYDWACLAAREAGLDPETIVPITSKEFVQKAPRPQYSALENSRLREGGLEIMRPWEEALRRHLRESRPH